MSITYSEGVFVALGIQQAMRMRLFYCYLWPVRLHLIFPHYLINSTFFFEKINEYEMCVSIFSKKFF